MDKVLDISVIAIASISLIVSIVVGINVIESSQRANDLMEANLELMNKTRIINEKMFFHEVDSPKIDISTHNSIFLDRSIIQTKELVVQVKSISSSDIRIVVVGLQFEPNVPYFPNEKKPIIRILDDLDLDQKNHRILEISKYDGYLHEFTIPIEFNVEETKYANTEFPQSAKDLRSTFNLFEPNKSKIGTLTLQIDVSNKELEVRTPDEISIPVFKKIHYSHTCSFLEDIQNILPEIQDRPCL